MGELKFTKNALREKQEEMVQLEKYLPTLQMKKAMLQIEVNDVRMEILRLEEAFHETRLGTTHFGKLLSAPIGIKWEAVAKVDQIEKTYENIAGVDVPLFQKVVFAPYTYRLFSTPPWLDAVVEGLRKMMTARAKVVVAREKRAALERELREVSIRVNLFEKKLVPEAKRAIQKIQVFLGDQALATIGRAKVAKVKIRRREDAYRRS